MPGKSYLKTVFRSIKQSFGRFMAILLIIALGVGFYAGLILTMPSFLKTGNTFINEHNLYDYRLLSTIGFSSDDITELQNRLGIEDVRGAYSVDALAQNSTSTGSSQVVRFHSLTENINIPEVTSGRMPQSANEILLDGYKCSEDLIGTTVFLTNDNDEDTLDSFNYREFTVVGIIRSPYYLNFQRSTSNIGGGTVSYYAYLNEDAFDLEYYTECFVGYGRDMFIYSDEYNDFIDSNQALIEDNLQQVIDNRFDDLLQDAEDEYQEAYDEYSDARNDAWQELIDAQTDIDDARSELSDARIELDDALAEINSGNAELEDARAEIENARSELETRQNELNSAINQLSAGLVEAQSTKSNLESQLTEVQAGIEAINTQKPLLEGALLMAEDGASAAQLSAQIEYMNGQLVELNSAEEQLVAGIAEVDAVIAELNSHLEECSQGQAQINEGYLQLEIAESEFQHGQRELSNGRNEYDDGVAEYDDAVIEFNSGVREYYDGLREFQNKMAMADRELGYAREQIIEARDTKHDTYVLGRDTNIGYVSFDNDSQIVSGIARVFPVFFFALAALVCSTTMQRMVTDERIHIGTMRALGYSETAIIMKYVIYSGLASVIGCVGGFLGGSRLFPYVIWQVYGMMYGFAPIIFDIKWSIFILAMSVSLICSVGVTIFTAVTELKGMPAELIRPKAPVAGKRILLERITFVWKKLKFLHKVTARNIFRFKKRMWMMIIGIAGCTALLITGFGIRDSVSDIVDIQYDNILTYQMQITFEDGVSQSQMKKAISDANTEFNTNAEGVLVRTESATHTGDAIRDVQIIISDDERINDATTGIINGQTMPWPEDGQIAISRKVADKNGLVAGDMITLGIGDNGETFTLPIAYVFDNYIYHYAFMTADTYEQAFGEIYTPDTVLVVKHDDSVDDYDYASFVAGQNDVKSWSVVRDMRNSFRETMQKLNDVVVLVIGCAALLAFIVLFNLNNINITERIREIATLKVLGFNRRETGSYVFRENSILVFIGFLFGIPLGILLHAFVMSQIAMDTVTFVVKIDPISYLYSLGFVLLFSVVVDLIMRAKIERIDMAESLKSAE